MTHDPIITKKIHFIKGILKKHTLAVRESNKINNFNHKIFIDNLKYGPYGHTWKWPAGESAKLIKWIDSTWNHNTITALHVYYLQLKGVSKQHTKDDNYVKSTYNYKNVSERLEKEFLVPQEAGKEGIYAY